jgi:hypothetical protein
MRRLLPGQKTSLQNYYWDYNNCAKYLQRRHTIREPSGSNSLPGGLSESRVRLRLPLAIQTPLPDRTQFRRCWAPVN